MNRNKPFAERNIGMDVRPTSPQESPSHRKLKIAFFGTEARFSHRVLQKIVAAGVEIHAVFCDASEPFRPHLGFDIHSLDPPAPLDAMDTDESLEIKLHTDPSMPTYTIIDIGWQQKVPVYSIGRIRSQAVADTLEALKIDVACVACFNKRIPPRLLAIPRLGFLNLHPSLLPDYRGPEPIQWILHDLALPDQPAFAQGGVTVHWMDADFDTGDIAMQRTVELEPEMSYHFAERFCADEGAAVYVDLLAELEKGNIPRRPQGDSGFYRGRMQHPY